MNFETFSLCFLGVKAQEMASQPSRRPRNVSPASSKPQPLRAVYPFSLKRNPSPTRGSVIRKSPSSSPVLEKTRCSPEHSRRSPTSPSLAKQGKPTNQYSPLLYNLKRLGCTKRLDIPKFNNYNLWYWLFSSRKSGVNLQVSFSVLIVIRAALNQQSGRVSVFTIYCWYNFRKPS